MSGARTPAALPIRQISALQSRSMITGIEHVAIASPDPERLAQWYVDMLGFAVNYRSANSRTVFVKAPDGSMIEIVEAKGASDATLEMFSPGLRHLALTVPDFEAAYRRLKDRGIPFLAEPTKKAGNSIVFFADCDGNLLHLLHRETPLP
jgi:glyoxylase I family protein